MISMQAKQKAAIAFLILALAAVAVIAVATRKPQAVVPESTGAVDDPDSISVFVNKDDGLARDYVPQDLVECRVNAVRGISAGERKLRREAAQALESMFAEAEAGGMALYIESGYRSWELQNTIYENVKRAKGEEYVSLYVALPGHSEHQTGLAMDVTNIVRNDDEHEKKLGDTREGQWLAAHAHRFGFILRYPDGKTDITGYSYEPWHFRYVGVGIATEIHDRDITLDEYMKEMGEHQ